jgi:anti-sigma factor RsiW
MTPQQHRQEKASGPGRERGTVRRRRPSARAAIAVIALASLLVPGIVALVAVSMSAF